MLDDASPIRIGFRRYGPAGERVRLRLAAVAFFVPPTAARGQNVADLPLTVLDPVLEPHLPSLRTDTPIAEKPMERVCVPGADLVETVTVHVPGVGDELVVLDRAVFALDRLRGFEQGSLTVSPRSSPGGSKQASCPAC